MADTSHTTMDTMELQLLKKDSSEEKSDIEDLDNTPPDLLETYYCGCGPCHPKYLQIFANKKFFTFLLSVFTLLEGAVQSGKLYISHNVRNLLIPTTLRPFGVITCFCLV